MNRPNSGRLPKRGGEGEEPDIIVISEDEAEDDLSKTYVRVNPLSGVFVIPMKGPLAERRKAQEGPKFDPRDSASWVPLVTLKGGHKLFLSLREWQWDNGSVTPKMLAVWRGQLPLGRNPQLRNLWVRTYNAYQRTWRLTLRATTNLTLDEKHGKLAVGASYNFHTWVEEQRFAMILPWMVREWPDQILRVARSPGLQDAFETVMRTEEVSDMKPNPQQYIYDNGEFPDPYLKNAQGGRGGMKNFAKTFATRKDKSGKNVRGNSFQLYVDAFSILSPLDIIFLQDELGDDNWLPHFCKFVRRRLVVEAPEKNNAYRNRPQAHRDTPHYEMPWRFCISHLLSEGLARPTDRGLLGRMTDSVGRMREFILARTQAGLFSVATFEDWTQPQWEHLQHQPMPQTVERDRYGQFCWFIASTIGNTDLPCAGTWFPYCAHNRDDVSGSFGVDMTQAEYKILDGFLMNNSKISVEEDILAENKWAKKKLSQLKSYSEADISTIYFPSPGRGQSRSSDLSDQTVAVVVNPSISPIRVIKPPVPEGGFTQFLPERPPRGVTRSLTRSRTPEHEVTPARSPGPSLRSFSRSPSPKRLETISEFEASPPLLMGSRVADLFISEEGGAHREPSAPRYPTGDDFVSYTNIPPSPSPESRVARLPKRKRAREVSRAADRPLVQQKKPRVDPDPDPVETQEEGFSYWPYFAFGGALLFLAYITEDPRRPTF